MRDPAKTFEDLIVWQKAHQFVLNIYKISSEFPRYEQFGITHQFRKAAVSVPANIAEGFSRKGDRDKAKFYNIAEASLSECSYYLILVNDLNYAETDLLKTEIYEIRKMLNSYRKKVLGH